MNSPLSDKLEPCPFCGDDLHAMSEAQGYFHSKKNCVLSDFNMRADGYSEERWNTRAALTASTDETKALREAISLAYGLLWGMGIDRRDPSDDLARRARETLLSVMDKAAQRSGIDAARAVLTGKARSPVLRDDEPDDRPEWELRTGYREEDFS